MAMKRYSKFSKTPELEPHPQITLSVIQETRSKSHAPLQVCSRRKIYSPKGLDWKMWFNWITQNKNSCQTVKDQQKQTTNLLIEIKVFWMTEYVKSGLPPCRRSLEHADSIPLKTCTSYPPKSNVQDIALNCIWWWGTCSWALEVWGIPLLPKLPGLAPVRISSMAQIDLFKS